MEKKWIRIEKKCFFFIIKAKPDPTFERDRHDSRGPNAFGGFEAVRGRSAPREFVGGSPKIRRIRHFFGCVGENFCIFIQIY